MNEKNNVEWSRLRADCSVLTDQHCQDNDICLLDHRIMAVAVILWFLYILDSQAASLIFFIMVANVLMPIGLCLNHTIFNTETRLATGKNALHLRLIFLQQSFMALQPLYWSAVCTSFFSLLDLSLALPG